MDELLATVRTLQDRQAIHDCLMTYSRAIDRLDRDLLISVYHDDAIDDHGVFVGSREAFADWAIAMHRRTHLSHQHCQFNSTCDLDGDVAHTETYYMFVGMNQRGAPLGMSGGRYIDRLEKRDGRWAIVTRICIRDWAPLDAIPETLDQSTLTVVDLDEATRTLMREGAQPSRDRADPSYMRPLLVSAARHEKADRSA
ncbi:nuclear transport factor 2 family protein [Sphingomonas echinoides]|uniref:Nuclear transport factor 2 family protein n=1 Tax=Sphingomonas echinoides TaxID=59803 RepID=A0ABU4PLY9_9SPHN|nr:nuclear transport factor 2 family protein [Sphingomonas echinoides]MDX5985126.1 nuclear transport factor 2 family protein [Sphingomonas echinoides]